MQWRQPVRAPVLVPLLAPSSRASRVSAHGQPRAREAHRDQAPERSARDAREAPKTEGAIKLSEHVKTYAEWAEKTNRSAVRKDRRVLTQFVDMVGDRF